MRKYFAIFMLAFAVASVSCANPATDKPRATVSEATQTPDAAKTAGAETLAITPENSKIEFVGSKVTGSHNGGFKQFSGTIELAKEGIEKSSVAIDIDTDSIFTDNERLTGHLKTADFFDVPKHPKANFISTKIEKRVLGGPRDTAEQNKDPNWARTQFTVTGNLEMHGVKKSISFPATIQVAPDAASVNAEFAINRKDFGINYTGKADDLIRDEVVMKLTVKAPRKQ
ncbi:MAG TPA: YceI family protein [Pyrinomonadaceae bacterium]|nr:YceI family protein [Pyrinomonadaceae bacterium]